MNVINWLIRDWFSKMYMPKKELTLHYLDIANKIGTEPEFIVAHAIVESNQKHLAIGKAGEYGLWQFLPETWKGLMGNADWRDIENQVIAYVKHSIYIIKRYNLNLHSDQDKEIFLWCWNAGCGAYDKKILPKITESYIQKIKEVEKQVII